MVAQHGRAVAVHLRLLAALLGDLPRLGGPVRGVVAGLGPGPLEVFGLALTKVRSGLTSGCCRRPPRLCFSGELGSLARRSLLSLVVSWTKNAMSLKQKIEDNLTLTVLSLLAAGFVAGFGAYHALLSLPSSRSSSVSSGPTMPIDSAFLKTQLDKLTSAHNARLEELQKKLMENERGATDLGNIDQYRQEYVQAARRTAEEIAAENRSFLEQLEVLAGRASEPGSKAGEVAR